MVVQKENKDRIRHLLSETIALMCKNGLNFKSEFSVEALVGITLDQGEEFFLSIKETVQLEQKPEPEVRPVSKVEPDVDSSSRPRLKKHPSKLGADDVQEQGYWSSPTGDEDCQSLNQKRMKARLSDRSSPPKRRHVSEQEPQLAKREKSQELDIICIKGEPDDSDVSNNDVDTDAAELNWDSSDLSYGFGSGSFEQSTANASMSSSFSGAMLTGEQSAPGIVETGPPPMQGHLDPDGSFSQQSNPGDGSSVLVSGSQSVDPYCCMPGVDKREVNALKARMKRRNRTEAERERDREMARIRQQRRRARLRSLEQRVQNNEHLDLKYLDPLEHGLKDPTHERLPSNERPHLMSAGYERLPNLKDDLKVSQDRAHSTCSNNSGSRDAA